MKLNLIYCRNIQNYIGYNNDLLYHIPEDMKYFKNITSQEYIKDHKNIVIMGYNTWKSIPEKYKPLPNRLNIIITKKHFSEMKFENENIKVFNDFKFCYEWLKSEEKDGNLLGEKFIIGGAQLYNHIFSEYNSVIDKIYETYINHSVFSSQTHYTNIDDNNFPKLDFNIQIFNTFKLINRKYCDDH